MLVVGIRKKQCESNSDQQSIWNLTRVILSVRICCIIIVVTVIVVVIVVVVVVCVVVVVVVVVVVAINVQSSCSTTYSSPPKKHACFEYCSQIMRISCNWHWHVPFIGFGCHRVTNHKGAKNDSQYKLLFSSTTPGNITVWTSILDENIITQKLFAKNNYKQMTVKKT